MTPLILPLLIVPAAALVATVALVPRSNSDGNPIKLRRWVTRLAALQLVVALLAVLGYGYRMLTLGTDAAPAAFSIPTGFGSGLAIYFDGISSLMFLMVSFVGWVICRYSIRYLDGDPAQGSYFCWTGLTLGAVALMVLSGNLILFLVFSLLTRLGLHRLLLHDPNRPAARRAAWTKFTIGRISDGAFVIALIMLFTELGTLDLAGLFAAAESIGQASVNVQVAAFLLVTAAVIKSAQFPFHTWLPQTLETPTPVSALMHAGIVNAGGYLIVRTSPIVSLAPWALTVLALIGAITACFAAVVMLTQTSIKKSLAYSTIAQMGFMMLQCGLGAFSAAMLHILAHSMYKAHAFLSSGSVISRGPAAAKPQAETQPGLGSISLAFSGIAATVVCLITALMIAGIDPTQKAGGLVLGSILCVALGRWLGDVFTTGNRSLAIRGIASVAALCLMYSVSLSIVDRFTSASVPAMTLPGVAWIVAGSIIAGGFALTYLIDRGLALQPTRASGRRWYVHASNGFYVESFFRSVFGSLARS